MSHHNVALHVPTVLQPTMTTSIVRAVALVALVVGQACFIPAGRGGRTGPVPDGRPGVAQPSSGERRLGEGYGPKAVRGKEPPTRLLARDGTSCVVSERKFESTTLGTSVWCTWLDADR